MIFVMERDDLLTRRRALQIAGVGASTTLIAGCTGPGDGGDNETEEDPAEEENETEDGMNETEENETEDGMNETEENETEENETEENETEENETEENESG